MRNITVKQNQSLFDIALEQYGDIQGVYFLVEDNGLSGITSNVFQGEKLLIRDLAVKEKTKEYLKPYDIATVENVRGKGIGYMRIGNDFIVK